ncbi:MAG: hypothetical protein J6D28_03510 [Bacilli bacterium]|nr:hypothetical protein [Bacilli bacterium]
MDKIKGYLNQVLWYQKNAKDICTEEEFNLIMITWYKEIYSECAKVYSKNEIKKIKKNLLKELKEQIIKLDDAHVLSYDPDLTLIQNTEQAQKRKYEDMIDFVNNIDDEQVINLILCSIGLDPEELKIQLNRRHNIETEKFESLSYNGIPCVKDEKVNNEIANKIFEEIINNDLLSIRDKVKKTLMTNTLINKLAQTRENSRDIVYSEIYNIFIQKLNKIEEEIQKNLQKISKKLAKKYQKNPNKEDLLYNLEHKGILKIFKSDKTSPLISEIKAYQDIEKEAKKYKVETPNKDCMEIYADTEVKAYIDEIHDDILNNSGVIINISHEEVEAKIIQLRKQINIKVSNINSEIVEMATSEEMDRIEEFANKIDIDTRTALDLLKDKNSIYTCLYNYVMGNEIIKRVEINDAVYSKNILDMMGNLDKVNSVALNNFNNIHTGIPNTSPTVSTTKIHRKILK